MADQNYDEQADAAALLAIIHETGQSLRVKAEWLKTENAIHYIKFLQCDQHPMNSTFIKQAIYAAGFVRAYEVMDANHWLAPIGFYTRNRAGQLRYLEIRIANVQALIEQFTKTYEQHMEEHHNTLKELQQEQALLLQEED